MITLEDLITPTTSDAILEDLYDTADTLGLSTTSWVAGSVLRTFFAIVAVVFEAFSTLLTAIAQAGFLDTATGGWLTLLAAQVYSVERVEATFASGTVTLTNMGGATYVLDPGELVVAHAVTGKTFVNTAQVTISPSSSVDADVTAEESGTESNAAAGTLTTLQTSLTGVTVTNADDILGTDEETDADLRERCRDSLGALSPNGPAAAYEYVAKTPSLVGGAAITRVKLGTPPGDGTLTVYLADADGAVSGGDVALVQTGFDTWATPGGSATVTAVSATGVPLTFVTTVYVQASAGLTDGDWEDLIAQTLADWVPTIPIGGIVTGVYGAGGAVPWRVVIGQIEAVDGVIEAQLTPETDVQLDEFEVATLDVADVTPTIVQV
jgi:hypothetical protein